MKCCKTAILTSICATNAGWRVVTRSESSSIVYSQRLLLPWQAVERK